MFRLVIINSRKLIQSASEFKSNFGDSGFYIKRSKLRSKGPGARPGGQLVSEKPGEGNFEGSGIL